METITIQEALLVMLVERDGVDATNVVPLVRRAAQRIAVHAGISETDQKLTQFTVDEADNIIVQVDTLPGGLFN